ncbi:MAG: hypothetical protein IT341_08870 [Chloroflexi bacterium]|nr:hypothetical protein [Chloroflexota bacterium]
MPAPIALTLAYLAVNLALTAWIERERAAARSVPPTLATVAGVARWGPPAAGAIYLLIIANDWAFIGFVAFFFGVGAWLMNGMLAYTNDRPDDQRRRDRP